MRTSRPSRAITGREQAAATQMSFLEAESVTRGLRKRGAGIVP
jgi:hypothetical protein